VVARCLISSNGGSNQTIRQTLRKETDPAGFAVQKARKTKIQMFFLRFKVAPVLINSPPEIFISDYQTAVGNRF
jgi:hypothetical protein